MKRSSSLTSGKGPTNKMSGNIQSLRRYQKFNRAYPGFCFGIVANFVDVFCFVSIHNKNERSVLCQKYVKVVRCR